jgi:hypothetical protein
MLMSLVDTEVLHKDLNVNTLMYPLYKIYNILQFFFFNFSNFKLVNFVAYKLTVILWYTIPDDEGRPKYAGSLTSTYILLRCTLPVILYYWFNNTTANFYGKCVQAA